MLNRPVNRVEAFSAEGGRRNATQIEQESPDSIEAFFVSPCARQFSSLGSHTPHLSTAAPAFASALSTTADQEMHLTRIRGVALVATSAVGNSLGHRVLALHTRSTPRPLVQVSKGMVVSSIGQRPKSPATKILAVTLILTRLPATSWYVSWYPVPPPKVLPPKFGSASRSGLPQRVRSIVASLHR
jgi:hypothetical protein